MIFIERRHAIDAVATASVVPRVQDGRMEHHRLRKYRGPETWARVRAAYLAGESAPSVARRFDVGLSNLRRRAIKEGWTRNRIADRLDLEMAREPRDEARSEPPVTPPLEPIGIMAPKAAMRLAVQKAAWLIGEGRAAEASALLRALEALQQADDRVAQMSPGPR